MEVLHILGQQHGSFSHLRLAQDNVIAITAYMVPLINENTLSLVTNLAAIVPLKLFLIVTAVSVPGLTLGMGKFIVYFCSYTYLAKNR